MTYTFHRNLNAKNGNKWSFKLGSSKTSQARCIYAERVNIKQPSGKSFERCLQGGNRSVFAWFKAESILTDKPFIVPENAKRVRFNPKKGELFFSIDGKRVDFLERAWLTDKGECFAI